VPDALPAAANARLQPVLDWIISEGRLEPDLGRFVDQVMRRAVDAGLPIWRFYIGLQLVHPQMVATGVLWRRGEGYEQVPRLHGVGRRSNRRRAGRLAFGVDARPEPSDPPRGRAGSRTDRRRPRGRPR